MQLGNTVCFRSALAYLIGLGLADFFVLGDPVDMRNDAPDLALLLTRHEQATQK